MLTCACQEERKKELRQRGDVKTQTSDARFDERFQLGHSMGGSAPWYSQAGSSLPKEEDDDTCDALRRLLA